MKSLQRQGTKECQETRERLAADGLQLHDVLHLIRCAKCRAFRRAVRSQRSDLETIMDVKPSPDLRRRTLDAATEETRDGER